MTHSIFTIGAESGSPVEIGDMMRDGGDIIFTRVDESNAQLNYAISMFNPADPVSGSGVIGTFEVFPLLAGTTQLTFAQADVLSIEFILDENAQCSSGNPIDIEFLSVLLELNISGDPATPPPEATATPQPTSTVDLALLPGAIVTEEVATELVNVTAAPPTLETTELPTRAPLPPIVIFSIVMVLISASVLVGLFVYVRRQ